MDETVLNEKWESLRRCLKRVEDKTPATTGDLARDVDAQDIIVLNWQRAVQTCVDIAAHVISELELAAPRTMADTFITLRDGGVLSPDTSLALVRATGFRNVAVHAYTAIDWAIVHRICREHLSDFRSFAREVDSWLKTL